MSIQDNINRVLWDKRYILIPDNISKPINMVYFIIRDLTLEDRNFYSFVNKMEKMLAQKTGVSSEDEILLQARNAGFWTPEDDLIIKKSEEHIAFLQAEKDGQKLLSRRKSLQAQIDDTIAKKKNTEEKKSSFYMNSADYYAHEVATYALLRRVILDDQYKLVFQDDKCFIEFKQNYLELLYFLINELMSEGMLNVTDLREIARSPEWRLTWCLQKENLVSLFNRPIGDFNINQKLLIYWSRVYDSAFESQEPPSQDIINDDEKFNEWLTNRESNEKSEKRDVMNGHQENMQMLDGEFIEACTCGMKAKNIGKWLGEKLPHAADCQYGYFRNYTTKEKEERANQIYSKNSDTIRSLIEKEQKTIDEHGTIEEQNLRTKKTRAMLGMKTNTITTYK